MIERSRHVITDSSFYFLGINKGQWKIEQVKRDPHLQEEDGSYVWGIFREKAGADGWSLRDTMSTFEQAEAWLAGWDAGAPPNAESY